MKFEEKQEEEKFVKILSNHLITKLSGEDVHDKITLSRKPSNEFIIGCLSATFNRPSHQKTISQTNSIAVSFLCKEFKPFMVDIKLCLYGTIDKLKEEGLITEIQYQKKKVELTGLKIDKPNFEKSYKFKKEIDELSKLCQLKDVPKYDWNLNVKVITTPYTQSNKQYKLVTIFLINSTLGDKENVGGGHDIIKEYETSMFNVKLNAHLEYNIESFLFEYYYEGFHEELSPYLRTLNCGAHFDSKTKMIQTEYAKVFDQELILPKNELSSIDGKEKTKLLFSEFLQPESTKRLLTTIMDKMKDYLNLYRSKAKTSDKKYIYLTSEFEDLVKRYEKGFLILNNNKTAMKAFNLMQKTFFEKDQSSEKPYESWRLFQIVYIVITIPDIVDINSNSEEASVLHVDTGGGKSETYFALVVFSAFLDRLQGKKYGLTAISKFPLRMLSIDQLQRIGNMFAWADKIREDENLDGKFKVGYLVGDRTDFPNHNFSILSEVSNAKKLKKKFPGKVLSDCPICKNEVILDVLENDCIIIHKCVSCKREFHLHFCDDEIYRTLPTFIVCTVDKMAAVGLQRKFKQLFGGKISKCKAGHGFTSRNDICAYKFSGKKGDICKSDGTQINPGFSTSPKLIIQDELHLIKEAFGTIDSHFETFIETMNMKFSSSKFKNIAMTATISGASKQIEELYVKKSKVIPGESPEGKGINDFFFTKYENISRRIMGLTPNMRDNQFATLQSLKIITEFIMKLESNSEEFCEEYDLNIDYIDEIRTNYKAFLTYHGTIADVNGVSYYLEPVVNSKVREKGYTLKSERLTSALSVDEIKGIIKEIKNMDIKNTKELPVSFATNLVSHGVDIERWNIMLFQGIPRSSAEYIQALSRVGRKKVGLVINWFYPNRIRDQSFYQNFMEYHKILGHHVEMVPIARYAKLGFFQTFNTLFCGAILNYLSDVVMRPTYSLEHYKSTFEDSSNLDAIKSFIKESYKTQIGKLGSKFFIDQINVEVEKRNAYLFNYTGQGSSVNFFPKCLADSDDPYFKTQTGMRGIQNSYELRANAFENTFVNAYKKRFGEDKEDNYDG